MMATVFFVQSEYDDPALKRAVFGLLDRIASLRIEKGARVLIKPNFLAPARPERAMTTHPLVLRAAVEYVLDKGGRPLVADSPGMGTFERLLREGGYAEALKGLDVDVRPFKETVRVDIGEPFGRIEIAREALAADVVVNLPKLKTHTQMLLTVGVKNLFGCIVGLKKPEWHMRSGVDRHMFARLAGSDLRNRQPRRDPRRRYSGHGGAGARPERCPAPAGAPGGRRQRAGGGCGGLPDGGDSAGCASHPPGRRRVEPRAGGGRSRWGFRDG